MEVVADYFEIGRGAGTLREQGARFVVGPGVVGSEQPLSADSAL